ncbi:helix-turn-helix domain-containing protein [Bacteroides sp.]|uniref:helix-turn-helix domain-containing protein n=1 Tax=Bacteroides sp. TaxID=29523 RepID=UPI0025BF6690|nr:helix-turn-helix domain-containing protein [Bacteroides sp.]
MCHLPIGFVTHFHFTFSVNYKNVGVNSMSKALLRSTNMTVQQIGDELNFPSQSFFGKYFKRLTGMSPKAYRE